MSKGTVIYLAIVAFQLIELYGIDLNIRHAGIGWLAETKCVTDAYVLYVIISRTVAARKVGKYLSESGVIFQVDTSVHT